MRQIGLALFVIGLLVAVMCGAKLPADPDHAFPNTWPVFVVAWLVAVAGLVMWRRDLAESHQHHDDTTSHGQPGVQTFDALRLMDAMTSEIAVASAGTDAKDPAFLDRLDRLMQEHIEPFVDQRQRLIRQLGLQKASEVLVAVAVGERLINRSWSAAADGYPDEANASLAEAASAMGEAQSALTRAMQSI
ncbi:hypothetical protein [Crateriforma conspicua]|uniref:hypothetical protein n=1 Tax=Crateriforma conspicua TaxID=2527996 RepID=UPI00118A4C6B|nr:hypothetical protein [Crateriforma conspicua]QDV65650.1 hypothetical protein Mal65_48230 [Crateriforma conspicua]